VTEEERDVRYRARWPVGATPPERERRAPEQQLPRSRRVALTLFALVPWLLYFALVLTSWWFVIFDGDPGTDRLGWILLALAVPCLFVAGRVSRWQRRWIRTNFQVELWARGPRGGGGGPLDWFTPS